MKNEIKEYKNQIKEFLEKDSPDTPWADLQASLLRRIQFYQHERLIHLIVTMNFAVMFILSFLLIGQNIRFLALTVLLLALLIPYIGHYYFLENSVQYLQRCYFEISDKANCNQNNRTYINNKSI